MQQNEIIKAGQLGPTEIMTMAKAFFDSGMFQDTRSAAAAMVKIQAGQELGIPPFAAMTGIHIIAGKPVVGAGIIASRVKASGKYDYEVLVHDEKECSIDFLQGKKKLGNSKFTIEDAKKAGTKNLDKFPRNMLFARAISNGVKWYCPDVFNGPVYVPEEMEGAKTEDIPHEETNAGSSPAVTPTIALPAISDVQLNKLVNRIGGGDIEAIRSARATFSFTPQHEQSLVDAILMGFEKKVHACTTLKELTALYDAFKGEVDASSDMQDIMRRRQEEIKKGPSVPTKDPEGWKMVIEACTTQAQLVQLYNKNKKVIDADPALQQLLADRRNVVNGKQQQPAGQTKA